MASHSDGAYALLEDKGGAPARSCNLWCAIAVLLTACLGFSAHTSKNALAPAEPALEALGLTPFLYSVIYALPTLIGILLPLAWGFCYVKHPRVVLLAVPFGILIGQLIVVIGLAMEDSVLSGPLLVFGWILVCACRAGGEVVQHTCLAQVMPYALTSGFVILVFFTHLSYVFCNLVVPRALSTGSDGRSSVLNMQLVLLIPGLISVLSACVLACMPRQKDDARSRVSGHTEVPFSFQLCSRSFAWNEWLPKSCRYLILWNGLAVGILHAFQSVTNAMSTSFGLSLEQAGDLNAQNQLVSLMALPLVGILGDAFSNLKEILIVVLSFTSLLSVCTLALNTMISVPTSIWGCALLLLQVVGILAPVVSLALVPRFTKRTGEAFGVVDSLKSCFQGAFVLFIGALRQESGGFQTATLAVCIGVGVMTIVSGLFFWHSSRASSNNDELLKDALVMGA